jgi:hypothetical protein
MGITQLPPVPVPTAKGEIVVGTATGAVKITAPTAANQSVFIDIKQVLETTKKISVLTSSAQADVQISGMVVA